uniref:Uncharacterized protein n=1 Tax=Oryza meridionalis TaxID=40149 RepID=A0A0E0C0E1_9ORYZ
MDNLPTSSTPRLHFVAALNHPSSFPCGSSPLPTPSQCHRRLTNRPAAVRLSPPPSPRPVSPPPLNIVRCGRYTSTPLDIATCPPLLVVDLSSSSTLHIRHEMQRMGIAAVSCGQRGEMVAAIAAVSRGQRGRDGSEVGSMSLSRLTVLSSHPLPTPMWLLLPSAKKNEFNALALLGAHPKYFCLQGLIPSICLFYRLTCSDLVPSSGLCTQELLASGSIFREYGKELCIIVLREIKFRRKKIKGVDSRWFRFPLHFSLSSIGDDEQPITMKINYFYKVCLGGYAYRPYGDMSWWICGLRCFYKESFPLHFSLSSIGDDEQPITMKINYFYKVLMYCTFPLHFSLSSIGDDEQPTIMEINYFYKIFEKISVMVQICDDEQPKTMEIKRVKIVVHVASPR